VPRIEVTPILARHLKVEPAEVEGGSVEEALASLFALHPKLRGYVLDDQGAVRKHVVVFVDGERARLPDPVAAGAEIVVMQALSGGSR